MADENYAIRVSFDGIDKAISDFQRLQTAVANIKAPVFNLGGDEAAKVAEASLKKLQLEIDALEKKKAQSAANDLARADQLAAKQDAKNAKEQERAEKLAAREEALAQKKAQREANEVSRNEANAQKFLAQLERQKAASSVRASDGDDKEAARIAQETLRFKQQIAAIDAKLINPVDIANAKALANEINRLNLEKIKKGFDDASPVTFGQFIKASTEKARDLAEQLQNTSNTLEKIGASFNFVSQSANNAFLAFDTAKTKVATLSSESANFANTAVKLSGDLRNQVTSTEILGAQYEILSSGFTSAADASEIARVSVIGAKAGFTDTATVADATTSILNAYGLAASDAANVVDQLAVVQDKGKTTIGLFAGQLGKVAPIAASAGVSLNELNAAVASVTIKGVKTETAVSGIRQAIVNLVKPTQAAQKELEKIGIVNAATTLKTEGLAGVLNRLKAAGVTSSSQLSKIFTDIDGLTAVVPLLNDGLENFNANLNAVGNASGKAKAGFDIVANSAEGRLTEATNKINEALVKIGAGVASSFAPLVSAVGSAVDAFNALPAPVQTAVGVVSTLGFGIFTLGAALAAIGAATPAFVGGLALFTNAQVALGLATNKTTADLAAFNIAAASTVPTSGAAGVAATGAASGFTTLNLALGATVTGLSAFAAIAGVAFGAFKVGELIIQERQLREFNEQLDASSKSTQQLGNQTFALAEKLRALREARTRGAGDSAKESGTLNIVKQQIAELEAQRKAVNDAASKTVNTDEGKTQKQAFLNTSKDLETQIRVLTKESKKLEEAQKATFSSIFTKQIEANTEELKKQAIALKEAQNQDKERAAKRSFDDAKTKRDIENANIIKGIEERNAISKGELDRKQALETEALKERQTLALQDKQRAFDDAQNAKKLQREEAIAALQRANQQKLDDQKEARAEKLRKDDETFAKAREERDKKNTDALTNAKQLISNEGAIATANPEDRAKLAAQLAEEQRIRSLAATQGEGGVQTQEQLVAKAKQIAQVQAIATLEEQKKVQLALDELEKANKAKQAELDKAEDLARANARRESDKAFEAEQQAQKLAFEQTVLNPEKQKLERELQESKLAFERGELGELKKQQAAEERALKLQQENEDRALKKAADAELEAIKQKQKAEELIKDRAFEDAKIERERAFKQQQRDLDKASAIEIQQILGKSAQQIIDAIAVAKGGTALSGAIGVGNIPKFADGVTNFVGGAALVGERGAELVTLPRGSNVIPANQTKQILNNSGGNKTYNFNITNAGDALQTAYQVQNELRRTEALNSGI